MVYTEKYTILNGMFKQINVFGGVEFRTKAGTDGRDMEYNLVSTSLHYTN